MNLFENVRLWSGFPAIVLYTVVLTLSACEATRDESVRQSHSALAAVGTAQNGVDEGTLAPESAALLPASASTVAFVSPTGLIASTGNLYWTSSELNEFGPDSATVWRAGKGNVPGNERVLYRESGDRSGRYYFGNIVYANPGAFYGYFVANYSDGGPTSQIKRVPLAGGAAIVLANSPASVGSRDLVTDGATLFWADALGIRSLPVVGGTVKTLVATSSVARISLARDYLYYAEGNEVSRIPKAGGSPTTVQVRRQPVTGIYVHAATLYIIWSEKGGAVRMQHLSGGPVITYQRPIAAHDITSVGIRTERQFVRPLFTDCVQPGNTYCELRSTVRDRGPATTLTAAGVGAGHLQWDNNSAYWGNASAVRRYIFSGAEQGAKTSRGQSGGMKKEQGR